MAITWDIEITNVNITNGRGNVTAIRTDSSSTLEPRRYSMTNTPIQTAEQRLQVLATIKEWDIAASEKLSSIDSFLSDLEQSAVANLNAWELTR